ncbi:hypothetical protein BC832DRAFT_559610 [Gaertneriomyces semiglobifer]|nr:hypothetical protein BC832DRAFT_559610 [Gaertneriomyces semiglobifer]
MVASGSPLIEATVLFVKKELAGNDPSHDWDHIQRVYNTAKTLAVAEGLSAAQTTVVELGALLHDVGDWKYAQHGQTGEELVKAFLHSRDDVTPEVIEQVVAIVKGVGFNHELGVPAGLDVSKELAVVQDADRLDAIGAIGIARTFSYGAVKGAPLYDPAILPRENVTQKEYKNSNGKNSTINHFYEKLLKLKGKMKTESGRRMAEKRHAFMELYLQTFLDEWNNVV